MQCRTFTVIACTCEHADKRLEDNPVGYLTGLLILPALTWCSGYTTDAAVRSAVTSRYRCR